MKNKLLLGCKYTLDLTGIITQGWYKNLYLDNRKHNVILVRERIGAGNCLELGFIFEESIDGHNLGGFEGCPFGHGYNLPKRLVENRLIPADSPVIMEL